MTLAVAQTEPESSTGMALRGPEVLALSYPAIAERHPAAVYLASLAPGSQRTMHSALDTIAGFLTGGRCDALTLDFE